MIQLARNLEMIPLAEGIETAGELEFLVESGCSYGQGFYLSRPVPAGDFERLWREGRGKVSPAQPTAL
jgi:EAL domain-containing protein (putative c-di-GMP-specific phosphodiesterase class I)